MQDLAKTTLYFRSVDYLKTGISLKLFIPNSYPLAPFLGYLEKLTDDIK
jgi:hypothetical protein